MTLFTVTPQPLPDEQLISKLQQLREHSLIDYSHYAVAAIVEINLPDKSYAYVSGVNVENAEHNRLSIHAEQNAMASAQTLFGGEVRFSKAWIMGAPAEIKVGSKDPLADHAPAPCGHCRQILLSLATEEAEIYGVTINGIISAPLKLSALLPLAFSESDLIFSSTKVPALLRPEPRQLLQETADLSSESIFKYLSSLSPHLISTAFATSPLRACILKLANPKYYAPGVLVQDIAFLTTDAVFTALGHAITTFGAKDLAIEEIYLYAETLEKAPLTASERAALRRFIKKDLSVWVYTPAGESKRYVFSDLAG